MLKRRWKKTTTAECSTSPVKAQIWWSFQYVRHLLGLTLTQWDDSQLSENGKALQFRRHWLRKFVILPLKSLRGPVQLLPAVCWWVSSPSPQVSGSSRIVFSLSRLISATLSHSQSSNLYLVRWNEGRGRRTVFQEFTSHLQETSDVNYAWSKMFSMELKHVEVVMCIAWVKQNGVNSVYHFLELMPFCLNGLMANDPKHQQVWAEKRVKGCGIHFTICASQAIKVPACGALSLKNMWGLCWSAPRNVTGST